MTAQSRLSRRGWLKAAGLVGATAAFGGLSLLPRGVRAAGQATVHDIGEFLAAQGQNKCPPLGTACQLPPVPDYVDFTSRFVALQNAPTPVPYVATFDYAGLANQFFFNGSLPTKIDHTNSAVMTQPLSDGSTSVRVLLYTQQANTWVIKLSPIPSNQTDFTTQLRTNSVLFGVRPCSVLCPSTPFTASDLALGDSFFDVTYIVPAGSPLMVDLVSFYLGAPAATLQHIGFRAQATGRLTSYFSAAPGALGRCTVSETALFATSAGSGSRVGLDAFPAETIDLRPLGT